MMRKSAIAQAIAMRNVDNAKDTSQGNDDTLLMLEIWTVAANRLKFAQPLGNTPQGKRICKIRYRSDRPVGVGWSEMQCKQ